MKINVKLLTISLLSVAIGLTIGIVFAFFHVGLASVTSGTAIFQGNVGIGTTNPKYKLDVNGPINVTEIYRKGIRMSLPKPGKSGSNYWTKSGKNIYYKDGRVGIGTTGPGTELDVAGEIRNSGSSSYYPPVTLETWGLNKPYARRKNNNLYLEWGGSGSGNMYITDHWRYTQPLYVRTGNIYLNAGNKTGLMVNTSGRVGIGTTNPADKLTVAGVIHSTSGGIKFPDGSVQKSAASGGNIKILTGTINSGKTIPLPSGYSQSQCKWMVSIEHIRATCDQNASWAENLYCYTDSHRKVTCREAGGHGINPANGTANYIIICTK